MSAYIRRATKSDLCRLAEIEVTNYRLNFYPIFQSDAYYFCDLQVTSLMAQYEADLQLVENTWVYDDGAVKGFLRQSGMQVQKLFVEPVLQGQGIGAALLAHAVARGANHLWALEENTKAIRFYARHGFQPTGDRMPEDGTEHFLIKLQK